MPTLQLEQLVGPARDLAQQSLDWADQHWDAAAGLFRAPAGYLYEAGQITPEIHLVRETVWYAVALLLRAAPGDRDRAEHAIATVLRYQFDAPDTPYDGTWYRAPEEDPPPADAVVWRDYDPNWRDFIGTALAVILIEYESQLSASLVARIDTALRRAIDGTIARDVPASYTNIALMTAFLLRYGADRFAIADWAVRSERLATAIVERFAIHSTFDEYNAPTYYGIDLYALALWRVYGGTPLLRDEGAAMEAALWRDIAQFYHAEMRNLAGPYDRSYGMDMQRYVSCLGVWVWLATGRERAPFPAADQPLVHGWDFMIAPLVALLDLEMPADARPHFDTFQGARQIERVIATAPRRVATAFVDTWVMLGGEESGGTHRLNEQYHPATIHWRVSEHGLGWVRLLATAPIDARVDGHTLVLTCAQHSGGDCTCAFQVAAPNVQEDAFLPDRWTLPGITVLVDTQADGFDVTRDDDTIALRYRWRDLPADTPFAFILRVAQP